MRRTIDGPMERIMASIHGIIRSILGIVMSKMTVVAKWVVHSRDICADCGQGRVDRWERQVVCRCRADGSESGVEGRQLVVVQRMRRVDRWERSIHSRQGGKGRRNIVRRGCWLLSINRRSAGTF